MPNVKTAISLNDALFREMEDLAREMSISRSRLVALALEEFLRRRQNRRLLEQIDAALAEGETPEERDIVRSMRRRHRDIVADEWS
jgi:predicted transcriptional regulator